MGNRTFSGSNIGGIAETQEMLDFCGKHNMIANVEVIPASRINEAYERLLKSDVKYRFSIDMASLRNQSYRFLEARSDSPLGVNRAVYAPARMKGVGGCVVRNGRAVGAGRALSSGGGVAFPRPYGD